MRPRLAGIAVWCTASVGLGWAAGYRSPGAYLAFWILVALAVGAARAIVDRTMRADSAVEAGLRIGITFLAIVVGCGLVLGAARRLTLGWLLAAEGAIAGGALARPAAPRGRAVRAGLELDALPAWLVGTMAALLAAAIAYAWAHAPLTLYDAVSYHLFFAGRWVQDHALSIIPTPFSDEAQAYAPANGEVFFAWAMLPFHGDLFARFGQLPFAVLGATALYALGRRLGASAEGAAYPPAFFLLSRPVLEQAVGANVDLICAALFAASLYFGILAVDRGERRDWTFWGICLGLFWGTKYVALVYTPVVLLIALARGWRRRALWALPGIAAFALPWYLRNWVIAGSPIYPSSLSLAGITLARGAFARPAMLQTVFHTDDFRLFPAIAAHGMGPTLVFVWLPAAVIGGAAMLRRGWWPAGMVWLLPWLMVPLYWFGFPVNIDSRFLMPALGPALLPLAFLVRPDDDPARREGPGSATARRDGGLRNGTVRAALAIGVAWILVGRRVEIPAQLPWFMQGWLALDGLLPLRFVPWFTALAALGGVLWRLGRARPEWTTVLASGLVVAPALVLAAGTDRWCRPAQCEYLQTTSPFIRQELLDAWRWVGDHIAGSTIAYTGINLPYPLTGPMLTNRVVYVNTDGRPHWRLHDYDRAYRAGRFVPRAPALAVSSGELVSLPPRAGPRDDAIRPRYQRMQGIREAWVDNLRRLQVDVVFVAALSAYEVDYVWHNEAGFPIEDEWARADPGLFRLLYENPRVRIYAVSRSRFE